MGDSSVRRSGDAVEILLQQAIVAAKEGRLRQAQAMLQRVLAQDPENVVAWLWMSGVVADPLKREGCLRRALELDPYHETARRGLMVAQREAAAHILPQAISAARGGDIVRARKLFTDVVVRDETSLEAWQWLSRVVETAEDREICFQNIVMLDPDDADARRQLLLLEQSTAQADRDLSDDEDDAARGVAATLAGDILGAPYRAKHTTSVPEPEPEPEPASFAVWAKYEDATLCPVCASSTDPADRRCPTCRAPLWVKVRGSAERSQLLWIVILLQLWNTISASTFPLLALFVVSLRLQINDTLSLLYGYVGMPTPVDDATLARAFAMVSRGELVLLGLPFAIGAIVTLALFLRWRVVTYLLLASGLLGLIGGIGALALLEPRWLAISAGVVGIGVALAVIVLALRLDDDFRTRRVRRVLTLDPGLKTGMDCLVRGRAYGRQGDWALAAIHFRRAAGLMPTSIDGLLGVARVARQLHDPVLARWALASAEERRPHDARVQAALASLASQTEAADDG